MVSFYVSELIGFAFLVDEVAFHYGLFL